MKTLLKVLAGLVALALLAVAGGVAFLGARKPAQRPPPDEKVAATPERLARGEYLVKNVTGCLHCHGDMQFEYFGMPPRPGSEGGGGFTFTRENAGVPGTVTARNLTADPETGKGNWTDGELMRAIREGIDKDGEALFPMMPYKFLRHIGDEDLRAVIAYIRTLKPIKKTVPPRKIDFPVSLFIKLEPQPLTGPVHTPDDAKDHLGYGRYLSLVSGCFECHTAVDDRMKFVPGQDYAGGRKFAPGGLHVVSANLTPHPDNYMGQAAREQFIGRFRAFAGPEGRTQKVPRSRNTVMPWYAFAGMTDQDLGAIYDYLKTLKPIAKKVDPFPTPAVAAR